MERKALIFNIQKYNTHDGNGVRTLVFFKGCPLRCKWCSNPEGQLKQPQVLFKKNLCVNCGACVQVCPTGVHKMPVAGGPHEIDPKAECVGCRKCEHTCPVNALSVVGEYKTISELLEIVEEDRPFYEMSGGGLTVGGGEPLMQPEALAALLMACRRHGINTAMETSGYARPEVMKKVAEFTDLFLFDIKHMDTERHYALTGVHNEWILNNLKMLLENRNNVKIRMPMLKGVNDGLAELSELVHFLKPYQSFKNFKGIDILPYHRLGENKYAQLGWNYEVKAEARLNEEDLARICACFSQQGFEANVLRH